MDPMTPTQPELTTAPPPGSDPATPPPIAPSPDDWMLQVPADLREKQFFTDQRGKTLGQFTQEAFNQHTEVGRRLTPEQAVQVPSTPDAPEWQGVFAKLRPETPEAYTFKVPEALGWDLEQTNGVKALLWQKGIADAQAGGLMEILAQAETDDAASLETARVAQGQEDHRQLREKFGPDYNARMELATRAMGEFGLTEHLKGLDMGTDPLLVPALAALGAFMSEGRMAAPGSGPAAGGQTEDAINAQLTLVRGSEGFKDGDPLVMQEVLRLTQLREEAKDAAVQAVARF